MQFRIISVEKLPLGTRVLRLGATGDDVRALQKQLTDAGFYFGKIDGIFGPLTQEAVLLLQRTFKLRIDGIAGNEVITALKNPAGKTGRIIYTIKKKENLRTISRHFKVNPCAWEGIPGQGNPQKRIYPGMRLLLHQRVFFLWNESQEEHSPKTALKQVPVAPVAKSVNHLKDSGNITGTIGPGWVIDNNGELSGQFDTSVDNSRFWATISAAPEVWTRIFTSRDFQDKIESQFQKITGFNFGLDLSTAPLNTIPYWPKFLKQICRRLHIRQHPFIVLPLLLKARIGRKPKLTREVLFFWSNIAFIAKLSGLIIFEQFPEMSTPEEYLDSTAQLSTTLRLLSKNHLNHKSLLTFTIKCWDWNLDTGDYQPISYKKAKLIRAMNPQGVFVSQASNLTAVTYRSHRQPHCLVYQTVNEWEKSLMLINKLNLLGIAVRNFETFGDEGIKAIRNCFAILPEIPSPDHNILKG